MTVTDLLRGLYIKCPYRIRAYVSPLLSFLPVGLKYGSTYRRFANDINRSESDASFVEEYRSRHLNEIITCCWKHNPYYRKLFRTIFNESFSPENFSIDCLQKLPILSKDDVRHCPEKFLIKDKADVDLATTSGTSGVPLKFYLDKDRGVKEWAFGNHFWGRIGYRPGMRVAVLRGVKIHEVDNQPWEYDRALSELRLSPFHLVPEIMDAYLRLLQEYKIRFIWGYPSAISILANYAVSQGWRSPSCLVGVMPISETLFPHQRDIIRTAFTNVKVTASYGLSEKAAIAGELPDEQDVYEFEPLYGITELVDDLGMPISEPGKAGRIVGTGFISTAMPLLRYDTGDIGELVCPDIKENCYRLRLKGIKSRWSQEFIVGDNGALISIAAINIHSPVYSKIQSFQFFQDTPGAVKVIVVPVQGNNKREILPFVEEIQGKVGKSVKFTLELAKNLERNERGKQRFIDQRLDIRSYR